MNVVLYLRYSSDRQNEQSIEGQRRICEQYCKQNKMQIVEEYIDRALSASKNIEKRESFQRMIKDSEKNNFQAVIVYKLDRFSRNRYDSAIYKNKLKKNGVRVISATEPISSAPEGILLESVLEGMAEFYSQELAQKVNRGMRETALKGNSCGGSIPFGYKIINKKYVIDTPRAEIVKEIFQRYAEGEQLATISQDMNARGIKTAKGYNFNKSSYTRMLKNKKYIGILTYDDIETPDAIPQIVEKNIFDTVQARLQSNKQNPSKSKTDKEFILTHKLVCGHCNSIMIGDSGTGKNGQKYYYYSCSKKKKKAGSCDKKSIAKDAIEEAVIQDIFDFLTPDRIEEIADKVIELANSDDSSNGKIKELQSDLREKEKAISNLFKLVEAGSTSESLFRRLEELEKEKAIIYDKIQEENQNNMIFEKDFITSWLKSLLEDNKEEKFFRRMLIDVFISSLTLFDNPDGTYTIIAVYNLTESNSRTFKFSTAVADGSPDNLTVENYIIFDRFIVRKTIHRIE